jgi:hypothetical protein
VPPEPLDLERELEERKQAQRVHDLYGQLRFSYADWHEQVRLTYLIYQGNWEMVWPDRRRDVALPKIANFVQIAADDRAKGVAAMRPSLICRPDKPGDRARAMADKRERIAADWFSRDRVWGAKTQEWALDAMGAGLTVSRVWTDFTKPKAERYPTFERIEPSRCLPDPVFTRGPLCDSMLVSYEEKIETLRKRYGVTLAGWSDPAGRHKRARVIEFADDEWYIVVAVAEQAGRSKRETLMAERHELGVCPFVIGARPTMGGGYRGEFYGSFGVLNFANRMRTLMLDDATQKVYPRKMYFDIENPEEEGPDALLEKQSPQGSFEYVQQPNQPFSNLQIMRDLLAEARAGVLLPPSRSGDPNESIISASGVTATQSQWIEDVRSIQRDLLAPMHEAALQVAAKLDIRWADATKAIGPGASNYTESYTPSKDVKGLNIEVRYGMGAGLDEINTNVMVLQQLGAGIIDERTAMELSPFVEDPQRVEKRKVKQSLRDASLAGLYQKAAEGLIPPAAIAEIERLLDEDDVPLSQAIAAVLPAAPLAPPEQATGPTPTPASPASPGLAGAGEALPPLDELLGVA